MNEISHALCTERAFKLSPRFPVAVERVAHPEQGLNKADFYHFVKLDVFTVKLNAM